jgi:hypothetical protein
MNIQKSTRRPMFGSQFEFLYLFKYKNIEHYDFGLKNFLIFKMKNTLKSRHYDFLKTPIIEEDVH